MDTKTESTATRYSSLVDYPSKLLPGVVFTLRKSSHGRRIELKKLAADVQGRINSLQEEFRTHHERIEEAKEAARLEPCVCAESGPGIRAHEHEDKEGCIIDGCQCRRPNIDRHDLQESQRISREIWEIAVSDLFPVYIKWALAGTTGLNLDGDLEPSADDIIEKMDENVTVEIGQAVEKLLGFTLEEQLGFKWPGIGSTPQTGQTQTTSA